MLDKNIRRYKFKSYKYSDCQCEMIDSIDYDIDDNDEDVYIKLSDVNKSISKYMETDKMISITTNDKGIIE